MNSIAFAAPILPGKTEQARRFAKEVAGPRLKDMEASRKAIGITREAVWIQHAPQGDMLVVFLEGDDYYKANRAFAMSKEPFDVWFKQEALAFTGIDYNQPLPDGFAESGYDVHVR